jgi:hypothetical protein
VVTTGFALAGLGVAVAMLVMTELVNRFDRSMRANGLGRLMAGSRTYAVTMVWFFRVAACAFGMYCLVSLVAQAVV